jgi:hypothetical protein
MPDEINWAFVVIAMAAMRGLDLPTDEVNLHDVRLCTRPFLGAPEAFRSRMRTFI